MSCLGNIIWFLFAGLWEGTGWVIAGILWCCTIIGIPIGIQCFKMAGLSFCPFGKQVVYQGGAPSLIINILWIFFGGLLLSACAVINGVILYITIIGIPFGKQCFKLAKLALMPFGAKILPAGPMSPALMSTN